MQRFTALITYSDQSGTYSEGCEFPAAHWSEAIATARSKSLDLARGDFQTLTTFIGRGETGGIQSFSARCVGDDDATALVTITEA